MDFQHTEEQRLLADSVRRMLGRSYDFEARRKIVASADGYSASVWRDLASMGLLSLPFAAGDGGFGGGAIDLVAPMQAFGATRSIAPPPKPPSATAKGRDSSPIDARSRHTDAL